MQLGVRQRNLYLMLRLEGTGSGFREDVFGGPGL